MKLNRKGYIAIEIILASIVSITIAVFLIDITVKLVSKTDNNYIDIIFATDKALLTSNLKESIENDISLNGEIESITCSGNSCTIVYTNGSSKTLSINDNKVVYGDYTKEVDKRLSGNVSINSSMSDDKKHIVINITFTNIFEDNDYDVIILIDNMTNTVNLAEHVTSLYTNADKSTVVNNEITYNTAPSVSLMNDRLGGTTTSLDGGNIRYYGASPNNYVYFNCSDYNNQSSDTCEIWRIIGVFNNQVKIMRNAPIGAYSWDTSDSSVNEGEGVNEWSQAKLMKLLNPDYESEGVGGSLYYNSSSGTCYTAKNNATTLCDFTTTGIKNDTTRNMITDATWNLGGCRGDYPTPDMYSNEYYKEERGTTTVVPGTSCNGGACNDTVNRTTSWIGKIALSYPSDYGYATDFNKCSKTLNNYNSDNNAYACRSSDWMYSILGTNHHAWLLTPSFNYTYHVFSIKVEGAVDGFFVAINSNNVIPTLYLSSEQEIYSGDGTEGNPYKLVG